MTATPHIVGWAHTPFGKLDALDTEQLFREVALPAIESAGLAPRDIDGVFVGHFNGGFVRGWYAQGESRLYVGPGSGLWGGFPLRLGVPSEILLLVLRAPR